MTRRLLLISLTLLLLAKQYVAEEDFCVWCKKDMANSFMDCTIEKLMNDPQFSSIPKNSINDVKSSMLAASNAMTSTSQNSEMKMLNGALAGEISGLVKSQMVLTGQSAHEVTSKIMDMIANCYIAVTGKPHAHFVHTLGNAVDFMLSQDQDDYDSPTAVASSSAQSGNNPPDQRPPISMRPEAPFRPFGPVNNLNSQAPNQQVPIRNQGPFPIIQRIPFNSQPTNPKQESPTNEQPAREFPINNLNPRDFNQQVPENNQRQLNGPLPKFNQQRPFNNQAPPTFNRQIPFEGQPTPEFNRQYPFNQRPQFFGQPRPNVEPQLPINKQPLPSNNQEPQIPSGGNQIVQENRPAFTTNNSPQENNFNPVANSFHRQRNIPANNPEQQGQSQPQTFQENKQAEPNNQFSNFPQREPNLNRNINFPRIQQNPSRSASSSAVAVSNVPNGGNFNVAPNVQHFRINPNDPQSGNRLEFPRVENFNQNRYQPGLFANRFPLNAVNRQNAINNQPNQAATAVASADGPSNNQPNQAATAVASADGPSNNQPNQAATAVASADSPSNNQLNQVADASASSASNDAPSNQNQNSEPMNNKPNAEASDSASTSHHRKHKHKPKINNVDSKEACALRFGETLFVYLTNSTIFPQVLDTSTPKSFASTIIPEVNRRAAIDSGYDISADEIDALSKIYVMPLPEGTNSQIYGEKMSKAVMVPLFKTGLLGDSCEDEAKSIGSNILKYLKLVIPYLNNIKRKASQSSSSTANSQNGNAVASASSNSGFPASSSAAASSSNDVPQSNSNNDATAVAKSGSDYQSYNDYYDDVYTDYDSYDYKTEPSVGTTPENYRNEYLTTTADEDENCDYDAHWQENTNQEPEESNNNQISPTATAETNSNSQSPFKSFWGLFQRSQTSPNENQPESSSTNSEANSNSQAPSSKFWSLFQGPNESPVQSSGSNLNSEAPRQKFWTFFTRPNEDPVRSSSSSANAEANSNSQAPSQKFLSYFQRPNENPSQSSSSSANAEDNSNSKAPRQKFWSFFQKPNENSVQSSSSSADAGANTNAQSPFGSFWSIFQRPKTGQASSEEGPVGQQDPGSSPISPGETLSSNQGPGIRPNQDEVFVPNQGPRFAPKQGPGFVPNQGPGFVPNQGPGGPNKAINNSPYIASEDATTQGPIEESGEVPNDGPGETDYWGSGMSPNIDEESNSSPIQESEGEPDDEPRKTDEESNVPSSNSGPGAIPNQLQNQDAQIPQAGLANLLANNPDANTKSQIDQLKAACIRSITKNGYNYDELTSTMAQISNDVKNIHSDWNGIKIHSFVNFETVVACTQVLQNVAKSMASQNARPREILNNNSENRAAPNYVNETPVNRVNETPENIIIQRNNNFNERPAIFPSNNVRFISRPFAASSNVQQGQNSGNFQSGNNNVNARSEPNYFRPPAFGQQNSFPITQRQLFSSASASASASENNEFAGGRR